MTRRSWASFKKQFMTQRISVTDNAKKIIDDLRKRHGELMFHQSGGCCDGSSPMCFPKGDLMINETDVWLGEVHGCDFYMSNDQFEYWKHTALTIDVTTGRGSSFSLEIPLGLRFVIKSRLFTEEEAKDLSPIHNGE
tara:strand:- start:890 stop:1300 length:411 start_codon:yes stop_codon:yes gene_type:complete